MQSDIIAIMRDKFSVFSPGRLRDLATAARILADLGFSLADFDQFVSIRESEWAAEAEERARLRAAQAAPFKIHLPWVRVCPSCRGNLSLQSIRTPAGPANKNGYQSLWYCAYCAWEEYSTLSVSEESLKYAVEAEANG